MGRMSVSVLSPRARRLAPMLLIAALGLSACSATTENLGGSSSPAPAASSAPTAATASPSSSNPATPGSSAATSSAAAAPSLDTAAQVIPAAPQGTPVKQATPARVKDTSGIDGVLAWDTSGYPAPGQANAGTLSHLHVTTPVDYAVVPAVGGQHAPVWMNAGTYTEPVPTERAVHDMEHGAVWISYRPSLSASDVATLQALVEKQSLIEGTDSQGGKTGNRYLVLSPWDSEKLPAPVVISAWGHQLRVNSASDPRLQKFIDVFRYSKTYSPELGAPVDGVPTGTGGNPAASGSLVPNPSGTLDPSAGM